jgi:hypothetical protein
MAAVRSLDVESVRIREALRVAVGGAEHGDYRLTLVDPSVAELVVVGGEAGGVLDGTLEAEQLLHGGRDECRLGAEELPLLGVKE